MSLELAPETWSMSLAESVITTLSKTKERPQVFFGKTRQRRRLGNHVEQSSPRTTFPIYQLWKFMIGKKMYHSGDCSCVDCCDSQNLLVAADETPRLKELAGLESSVDP
jgi:hypothetical protein